MANQDVPPFALLSAMPRPKTIRQSEFPYHLSARCINREWFRIPMESVWEIMCRHLYFAHRCFDLQIHLFVLMNNHFHLVATTPMANVDQVMEFFMKKTSDDLGKASGRINQTYGGRYHRTIIGSTHYYLNAYKYIYRNPIEAGIINQAEAYEFSTLGGLLGLQPLFIPLVEDYTLFTDPIRTLKWINTCPGADDITSVREALKKSWFQLPIDRNTRKPNRLEYDLL